MYQYEQLTGLVKALRFWGLGIALGMLAGGIPLLALETNRHNNMRIHITWWIGLFLSAMVMGIVQSDRVWRWVFAVGLGYLVVVVFNIFIGEHFFLFPFSILLLVVMGAPPAFAGAYFGKWVRWICIRIR